MATFGEKLKQLRDERGLTQAELADIIGTSKQVISRYETNQRTPKITVAQEYADRLNVNLSLLIDDNADLTFGERVKQSRENIETIAQRILSTMKEKNTSYGELSHITGIPKSALQRYATGETEKIPIDRIQKIAVALGVESRWILGWSEDQTPKIPQGFAPLPETERLPIIGAIACGTPITAEQNVEGYVDVPATANADFCLICKGDSMTGAGIYDGDIVYIHKQEQVENGQIAAVRIDNEATLKRFYYDGDKVTLLPANSQYAPMIFVNDEINQLHIEGLAVGFYHRL